MKSPQANQELTDLSGNINSLHEKASESAENAVIYAIQCGQKLIEVKQRVGHGNFLPWLVDNFKGSQQTANSYMRVAANYKQGSNLPSNEKPESIREALRQLSAPTEREITESEKAQEFTKKWASLVAEINALDSINFDGITDIATLMHIRDKAESMGTEAAKLRLRAERETGRLLNELQECGLSLGQINELMQYAVNGAFE